MIAVQNVSKYLGQKELFKDVSFHIHRRDRIGVVGPNGAGKTTLFRIILGEVSADTGSVTRGRHVCLGYLPQQWTPSEARTVLAHTLDASIEFQQLREELRDLQDILECCKSELEMERLAARQSHLLDELERMGGYDFEARARKILFGLGFSDQDLNRPLTALSGGWLMRVELARLLLREPDVLLLDEPTNHLDLESLLWLETYLLNTQSAIMLISHDRTFLNHLVSRVFELEEGHFDEYTGNYDSYITQKERRRKIQLAARKNQQERIRQVERFIARNRYRKDRARQVQSRIKALERVERIEVVEERQSIRFRFPEAPRSNKRVLELKQVSKSYGSKVVYNGIDLLIERGDRIALLGPNGAGKSTLLKILAGTEPVTEGVRKLGNAVQIGYYAQHHWEQLVESHTVFEEAVSEAGHLTRNEVRGLLGAFHFRGQDVDKKVSTLSGGERARLTLCKLLMRKPNLLLLDEPTNHLDIASREVLEQALVDFTGTLCFISHDRRFINALANKVLVIHSTNVHLFPGNYDDFETTWKDTVFAPKDDMNSFPAKDVRRASRESGKDPSAIDGRHRKRLEAQWRNEMYRLKRPLVQELERVEKGLDKVHKELDELNRVLASPETYENGENVQRLQVEYRRCKDEIQRLTERWEEISLELEHLEQNFWRQKRIEGAE